MYWDSYVSSISHITVNDKIESSNKNDKVSSFNQVRYLKLQPLLEKKNTEELK